MLKTFLTWMEQENLIDQRTIAYDDDEGFHTRFLIQKGIYVAQCLGLQTNYTYGRYLNGPYSTELADDYYAYADDALRDSDDINPGFKRNECLQIMKHDDDWLEIATTLIHMSKTMRRSYDGLETLNNIIYINDDANRKYRLINKVWRVKYPYSKKFIKMVYKELLKILIKDIQQG